MKVQENCIDLVGRIADRGAEFVSAKEGMRICFELLDLLKAHKKAMRLGKRIQRFWDDLYADLEADGLDAHTYPVNPANLA